MALDPITAIANAITEGAKALGNFLTGKELNRLRYQVEAGFNYVFVDEKSGQYKDISDDEQKKLKIHFRKQIFDEA